MSGTWAAERLSQAPLSLLEQEPECGENQALPPWPCQDRDGIANCGAHLSWESSAGRR